MNQQLSQYLKLPNITVYILRKNISDIHLIIPDHIHKQIPINPFNQHQVFKVGVGYPLNYIQCYKKLHQYLQLYKFQQKSINQYSKPLNLNAIDDRIGLIQKPINCFDMNMVPYFKQLNDKLFLKEHLKLGNYQYKILLNEHELHCICHDFFIEIHAQVKYNIIQLQKYLELNFNQKLSRIIVDSKVNNDFMSCMECTGIVFQQNEILDENVPYIPGYLYI